MLGHRLAAACLGGALLIWTTAFGATLVASRLPTDASGDLVVVFGPASDEIQVMQAIAAAGGRFIERIGPPWIWRVAGDQPGFVGRLQEQGAIAAYRELPSGPSLAGCMVLLPSSTLTSSLQSALR